MNIDPDGQIAIVDDVAVLVFIGLCITVSMLTVCMSTPEFRRSWTAFCTAAGNGLSWIGTSIANGGRAAWNWSKAQIIAATTAIKKYITVSRADNRIKSTVKRNSKQRYWSATVQSGYIDIGRALTYSQAVKEVRAGKNVFTVTSYEAKAVAIEAGGTSGRNNKNLYPEIDSGRKNTPGYYYHYHTYNRKGGHVYYLF